MLFPNPYQLLHANEVAHGEVLHIYILHEPAAFKEQVAVHWTGMWPPPTSPLLHVLTFLGVFILLSLTETTGYPEISDLVKNLHFIQTQF